MKRRVLALLLPAALALPAQASALIEYPLPPGSLSAVSADWYGSSTLWMIDNYSRVFYWDLSSYTWTHISTTASANSVTVAEDGYVWILDSLGTARVWDGSTFYVPAEFSGMTVASIAVNNSSSDIYATDTAHVDPSAPYNWMVEHWNGDGWSAVLAPTPPYAPLYAESLGPSASGYSAWALRTNQCINSITGYTFAGQGCAGTSITTPTHDPNLADATFITLGGQHLYGASWTSPVTWHDFGTFGYTVVAQMKHLTVIDSSGRVWN